MDDLLTRVAGEPVGRLGTVTPQGRPHVVPVVFAMSGDSIVTAVDWKPKSGGMLQRILNIEANPSVSLLVDHYSDDWEKLWWIRVDGEASIHHGDAVWREAIEDLAAKYDQYRSHPPDGSVISIVPARVNAWASRPSSADDVFSSGT